MRVDLEEVRARIETAQAELAALRAVPTPSADVEHRVRSYVELMARPQISGIGKGEQLRVIWPGAGWDTRGPREDRAEVLPMMALLFPDAMTAALMSEVERMASDAVPIAELEREIEEPPTSRRPWSPPPSPKVWTCSARPARRRRPCSP